MYELDNTSMRKLRKQLNIDTPSKYKEQTMFNRFRIKHPDSELDNAIAYVFFTKPDCYMFAKYSAGATWNKAVTDQYQFHDTLRTDPQLFLQLQQDQDNNNFMSVLYNHYESFDTTDRVIKTRDSVETANDWKVVYGHKINDSLGAGTFNVTFSDNRNRDVFKLLEIWINYIDLITKGYISPHPDNRDEKILDYAASMYYIVTSEDGASIIHYCKYDGVFPINIPDSAFSHSGGKIDTSLNYNIQFQYSLKDPSPASMKDLILLTKDYNNGGYIAPSNGQHMTYTWCNGFYVEETKEGYKLRFV